MNNSIQLPNAQAHRNALSFHSKTKDETCHQEQSYQGITNKSIIKYVWTNINSHDNTVKGQRRAHILKYKAPSFTK